MHMFNVDESYDENFLVLTAICVEDVSWRPAFNQLKAMRHEMREKCGIKVRAELHARKFIRNCSDGISTEELSLAERRRIFEVVLLGAAESTAYQLDKSRRPAEPTQRSAFHQERQLTHVPHRNKRGIIRQHGNVAEPYYRSVALPAVVSDEPAEEHHIIPREDREPLYFTLGSEEDISTDVPGCPVGWWVKRDHGEVVIYRDRPFVRASADGTCASGSVESDDVISSVNDVPVGHGV